MRASPFLVCSNCGVQSIRHADRNAIKAAQGGRERASSVETGHRNEGRTVRAA
jgi:hypothetical protein